MSPLAEKVIMMILDRIITPDVIAKGKKAIVMYLKSLADQSDSKIDNYFVELVAEVLGVQL